MHGPPASYKPFMILIFPASRDERAGRREEGLGGEKRETMVELMKQTERKARSIKTAPSVFGKLSDFCTFYLEKCLAGLLFF